MANNVGNIKVKLNLDSAQFEQGMNTAVGSIRKLSTVLGALGVGFGAAQIVKGVKDIASNALKASSNFEQANISFGVMLGSAEKAQKLVKELESMANVTPFETQDLLDASKTLLNFGINVKEIVPDLQMLGDISGGNAERMRSLTLAFAQMSSAGRLMGQDLLQMINAGFNPLQVISEKTGKSMAVLKDEMSEGKISVEMVRQAFIDATSEGGRFYGMMNKQSESFEGLVSTMSDAYTIMTRSVSDMLLPALKEQVRSTTEVINAANDSILKFKEWAATNQQTVGAIKDACVAISVLAVAIPLTNKAVVTIIASMRSFGVITAKTTAYQIAFATYLKGDVALALIQYRAALTATIAQVRALTIALLQCPLTWVTVALGAGAAAWWAYQQNAQSTVRAIEELNAAQDEQVDKTTSAIRTLKELDGAQKLNYQQTKKLDEAIAYLTEKYPGYINRLREELRLKGEISRATAEQIANEMMLSKIKGLQEQRVKLNKDMMRDLKLSTALSKVLPGAAWANKAGGRYGITRSNQKRDDTLNAERKKLEAERKAIVDELTALGKEEETSTASSSTAGKKSKKKTAAQLAAEEKRRRKELLDYKIALLDVEKYEKERTEEEIYQIELQKANLRLASAKKGTSEYAEALAAKLKLEQEHAQKIRELSVKANVDNIEDEKRKLVNENAVFELQYEANAISKKKLLELEIDNIIKRKELEKQALAEQLKLVENNNAEQVKLKRASNQKIEQLDLELMRKEIELQKAKRVSFKSFTDDVSSSWGSTVSDLLNGNIAFSDVFNKMLDGALNSFGNYCGQMVQQWLQNNLQMSSITQLFRVQKAATDAATIAGNSAVSASNVALSASDGVLTAANTALTTSNVAVAASSGTAAATTATSAGVMAGAATTIGSAFSAMLAPVATLATTMATLALTTSAVAMNMSIIALATGLYALESLLANLTTLLLNVQLTVLAGVASIAAKAMATLAIANAANSAAQIPFVGWAIAPGAALSTAAAIMAADSMVQFREKGGPVTAGQPYIVGEKRPELFIPDRSGTILPDTSALGGSGGSYTEYNVPVTMVVSATDSKSFESRIDDLTDRIHSNLEKKIKRRKLAPLGT